MMDKQVILIVDDVDLNRELLREMLEEKYDIMEAADGEEAVALMEKYTEDIDLVLLDVIMPRMDGFGVLQVMKEKNWIQDIPVIMVSADNTSDSIARGFDSGVTDYVGRPYDWKVVKKRVENTLMLYAKQKKMRQMVKDEIISRQRSNRWMIDILSTAIEFRNGETGMHIVRVRIITQILLEAYLKNHPEIDMSLEEQMLITDAAALHDIGKIVIPEAIINKPGRLTKEEFEIMKTHSKCGADMIDSVPKGRGEKLFQHAYAIARWHHERWTGGGYPDGLKGNEIPLSAQLVALADVYDALVSERVYKAAYSHEKAIEMILGGECGIFNPELMECLREEEANLDENIRRRCSEDATNTNIISLSEEILKQRLNGGGII